MWARRITARRRNSHGVASIRRDTYNTVNGFSVKGGWWEVRAKVWERDGGKCQNMVKGKKCLRPGKEVHHIVPLSRGGTNSALNMYVICIDCHNSKHAHLRSRSK